jgi:hypothetical protein
LLFAEARVETERSSRYLVQLCRHVSKAAGTHPQMRAHVEWSGDRGVIGLDRGRCVLHALPGVLTLRVEAPDEDTLRRVEQRVGDRLEQIGRRDHLTVTWTPPRARVSGLPSHPPDATEGTRMTDPSRYPDSTRRWVRVAVIVAVVAVLLVAVMLLIGGGGHGPGRHF